MNRSSMKFLPYFLPEDLAVRIYRRKPHWFHGNPIVKLYGEGGFGELTLDFGDVMLEYRVYIKDRQKILDTIDYTILNFDKIMGL